MIHSSIWLCAENVLWGFFWFPIVLTACFSISPDEGQTIRCARFEKKQKKVRGEATWRSRPMRGDERPPSWRHWDFGLVRSPRWPHGRSAENTRPGWRQVSIMATSRSRCGAQDDHVGLWRHPAMCTGEIVSVYDDSLIIRLPCQDKMASLAIACHVIFCWRHDLLRCHLSLCWHRHLYSRHAYDNYGLVELLCQSVITSLYMKALS